MRLICHQCGRLAGRCSRTPVTVLTHSYVPRPRPAHSATLKPFARALLAQLLARKSRRRAIPLVVIVWTFVSILAVTVNASICRPSSRCPLRARFCPSTSGDANTLEQLERRG